MTMRRLIALLLVTCTTTGIVSAQWISSPTPNAPRTPDGRVDLDAPVPRVADGRPDLSGIWYLQFKGCGSFGCADYSAGPEFLNFGASLPGGLPYLPWAAALVKERSAAFGKDDPVAACLPGGALRY